MYRIQTFNNIAVSGLNRFPRDVYEIASDMGDPDAILLRSHNLHDMQVGARLKAVGRAGAGTNNVPVARLSDAGVAVFNAPGANANAVKELVIGGMLLAVRNLCQAWQYVRELEPGDDLHERVEQGKKQFVGSELPGRTLGVVGLGAIGVQVANAARALGMRVLGYDPTITVQSAWKLAADVEKAISVDDLLARSDFVTVHVPLNDQTRGLIGPSRIGLLRRGVTILNFARAEIVDEAAMIEGLDAGRIRMYVCDFPTARIKNHPRVIALPHIGASTHEAEENCAVMVADQLRDFLEHGTVTNSVNFPEAVLPRGSGYRLIVVNRNVPNMVGQVSTDLANAGLNILDMLNKSRGELAYNLIDTDTAVPDAALNTIRSIEGVLSARVLDPV